MSLPPRLGLWLLLGILAVAAVAGSVYGLQRHRARQQSLAAAVANLQRAASFHTLIQLQIYLSETLNGRPRPFTLARIKIDGDAQRSSDTAYEFGGTLYADIRGRGNIFFTDGELRLFPDTTAFRLANLPALIPNSQNLTQRWTYVDTPLLVTRNGHELRQALASLVNRFSFVGKETANHQPLYHFRAVLSPDEEKEFARLLQNTASSNQAFHVIARLLTAGDAQAWDVWVNAKTNQLDHWQVEFTRPGANDEPVTLALLKVSFADVGKGVTIERPVRQSHVSPGIFGRLFGSGEIAGLQ